MELQVHGKTEIYLQLIKKVTDEGRTAIVLVPEISLTPQMLDRFISRFGKEEIRQVSSVFLFLSPVLLTFPSVVILTINFRVILCEFNMFFLHTYADVTKTAYCLCALCTQPNY